MEFSLKLKEAAETSESFMDSRQPLQDKKIDNTPFVAQIQDLMTRLIRKRNELKEAKLQESNLRAKGQDQEERMDKMEIEIDHLISKEELNRSQLCKVDKDTFWHKETIRELKKQIQYCKNEVANAMQTIIVAENNTKETQENCNETNWYISEKEKENQEIEEQLQNLQIFITRSQNSIRQKFDVLTNTKIQETEIISMLQYIKQRAMLTMKARNKVKYQNKTLDQNSFETQVKIGNVNKEINELEWHSDQLLTQNEEIVELNYKLQEDLMAVHKHLETMEKMNQTLRDSIENFGGTGQKVTRLIHSTRNEY